MSRFVLMVISIVVGWNLLFLALQLYCLRFVQPYPKKVAAFFCGWTAAMLVLFFFQGLQPMPLRVAQSGWLYFPFSVEMSWNLVLVPLMTIPAAVLAIVLAVRRWRRITATPAPARPAAEGDLSRRKFIALACGATPAVALGMGVHGTFSRFDLRVRKYDLPLANLPPELDGFTIAHVSDIHSGVFCGPKRIGDIMAATNDLNADLIAVTGDIINHSMAEFPDVVSALKTLRSRYGMYLCEGNHDCFPGPMIVYRECVANGLNFLYSRSTTVLVNGRRLVIGGVRWLDPRPDTFVTPQFVSRYFPERQPGDVRILLAHHPHFLDYAESADLVLSGHTHGGQLMLGPVGFGPLFFKYWSGLYQRGETKMVVSNGAGDWFPCRIGAPAEIGLLRLTRAA